MNDVTRAQDLIGSDVYDSQGEKIGRVGNVYLDDATQQPEWVTVRTGLFGTRENFIPLSGAATDHAQIKVDVTKEKVRESPRIETRQGHLSDHEGQNLYAYYGITRSRSTDGDAWRSARTGEQETQAGRADSAEPDTAAVEAGAGPSTAEHVPNAVGADATSSAGADATSSAGAATTPSAEAPSTGSAAAPSAAAPSAATPSTAAPNAEAPGAPSAEASNAEAPSASAATATQPRTPSAEQSAHPADSGTTAQPEQVTTPLRRPRDSAQESTEPGAELPPQSAPAWTMQHPADGQRDRPVPQQHSPNSATSTSAGSTPTSAENQATEGDAEPSTPAKPGTPDAAAGRSKAERSGSRELEDDTSSMTRSEERLNVNTETVETGRVRLRKYVVTEHETVTVPVSREEIRIERETISEGDAQAPVDDGATPSIGEDQQEIILHAERPVVRKEAVPVERITFRTEKVTEERTVEEEVRHERFDIDEAARQHSQNA